VSDIKHRDEERLSRRQVAERLVDIAYALTADRPLELNTAGRRITVRMGDELRLGRKLKSEGDRVGLELDLTWAIPQAPSATKPSRSD
jgi:amphi-Trp domain-containing protein